MEEKREEADVEKKRGQIAREMDNLEEVTATLLKKLDILDSRLESICRDPEPSEIKGEATADDRVSIASALGSFSGRVQRVNSWIDSILERLEL